LGHKNGFTGEALSTHTMAQNKDYSTDFYHATKSAQFGTMIDRIKVTNARNLSA